MLLCMRPRVSSRPQNCILAEIEILLRLRIGKHTGLDVRVSHRAQCGGSGGGGGGELLRRRRCDGSRSRCGCGGGGGNGSGGDARDWPGSRE
jgi:hypothetical protein